MEILFWIIFGPVFACFALFLMGIGCIGLVAIAQWLWEEFRSIGRK